MLIFLSVRVAFHEVRTLTTEGSEEHRESRLYEQTMGKLILFGPYTPSEDLGAMLFS